MIRVVISSETDFGADSRPGYRLAPDVLLALVDDGSARLLDLGGTFYALTPVTAELLLGVLGTTPDRAAERVASRYGAETERVAADLAALTADLARQGVLLPAGRPRPPARRPVLAALLSVAVRSVTAAPLSLRRRAQLLLGLAHLTIHRFGWPATVRSWPGPRRLAVGGAGDLSAAVDGVVRDAASRHALDVACKERSLVCWWLLRDSGVAAEMVVGVSLYPFACHCWCESGGRTLTDFADRCGQFTPVARYA